MDLKTDSCARIFEKGALFFLYPNRRAFNESIEDLYESHKRNGDTFSLILIDIDFFKKFNDTHGHAVGDKVLIFVAGMLDNGVKGCDMVTRFGGEAFAILLPETGSKGAMVVADQLRDKIGEKALFWATVKRKTLAT
ncbi:MAG: GGDEF domain-containing protein [Pseudomonadales bacterium]|nr:GGDEF domain-containing protein [Pseudomonadales bacterium]